MCGIVGFTGNNEAAPILLDGLSKLEYRGYDSAGIAVRNGDAEPEIVKAKGKLKVLKEMTNDGKAVKGACGIGHTRWATHGEPSTVNAHPHCSDDENVIAVHNGIIENYQELREKLIKKGYTFKSETDTEVAVKLIDYYYKKYLGTPVDALNHALVRIRGSYALAVMFKDYPGEIYAARKDSPMIIGVTGGESYLASDVPAILKYTRNVYYIGNMELAKLTKGAVAFYNLDGEEIQKIITTVKSYAEKYQTEIPVIVAGGICDREDVRKADALGADGIQVATRFITTEECDANIRYKQAHLKAKESDIAIVKSPVGMPGRAIMNKFMTRVMNGEQIPHSPCHGCLAKCSPKEIPYCITDGLINAVKGNIDDGLLFCGAKAWRADRLETVSEVINDLF